MTEEDHARLRAWFAAYCGAFYTAVAEDDRNISLKEEHTFRVCGNMELLAEELCFDGSDRRLAAAVALFHDVGRFEQYRRYKTFRDSDSINHAAFGAKVLTEAGVLESLSEGERAIIVRAVTLHNVFVLPAGLDERLTLFVRLVRDADKLDIWRVFIEYYEAPPERRASAVGLGLPDAPVCSSEIVEAVCNGKMANLSLVRTLNDFKLLQLSWVYDLNFPKSFQLLRENGYLRRLVASMPETDEGMRAVAAAESFLEGSCAWRQDGGAAAPHAGR
jgi:putative nucleotidyltransferase with HDIG domain